MDKFRGKYRIQSTRLQNFNYGSNAMYYITICTHNRKHHFGKVKEAIMNLSDIGNICYRHLQDISNHFSFIILDEAVIMPDHIHVIFIIDRIIPTDCVITNEIAETPNLGVSTNHNSAEKSPTGETPNLGVSTNHYSAEKNPIGETPNLGVSTNHNSAEKKPTGETPNLGVSTEFYSEGNEELLNPTGSTINPKRRQTLNASKKWQPGTIGVVINQFKRAVTIDARKINPSFGWQSRYYDHIIRDEADYWRIKKYIIDNPKNWDGNDFNKS